MCAGLQRLTPGAPSSASISEKFPAQPVVPPWFAWPSLRWFTMLPASRRSAATDLYCPRPRGRKGRRHGLSVPLFCLYLLYPVSHASCPHPRVPCSQPFSWSRTLPLPLSPHLWSPFTEIESLCPSSVRKLTVAPLLPLTLPMSPARSSLAGPTCSALHHSPLPTSPDSLFLHCLRASRCPWTHRLIPNPMEVFSPPRKSLPRQPWNSPCPPPPQPSRNATAALLSTSRPLLCCEHCAPSEADHTLSGNGNEPHYIPNTNVRDS